MITKGLCIAALGVLFIGAMAGACSSSNSSGGDIGSSSGSSGSSSGSSGASSGSSGASSGSSGSSGSSSGSSGSSSGSSGSSSGSSGSSGDAGGDSGDAGQTVSCPNYCAKIKADCTGQEIQFLAATADADCTKACGYLPVGTYADTVNSVGCRQYHAGNTPPATHCPHASIYGGGVCGAKCDDFCTVATQACAAVFASKAACVTACNAWTVTPGAPVGPNAPQTGNTYNCRTYHLLAALSNPVVHCAHIAKNSAVCQ